MPTPAVTASEFLAEYDRFDIPNVNRARIQRILDRCERKDCPLDAWGEDQKDGIMLLTAHLLDLELMQAAKIAGMGASAAAGQSNQVSGAGTEDHLNLTPCGLQFRELRDSLTSTIGGMPFGGGNSAWIYFES